MTIADDVRSAEKVLQGLTRQPGKNSATLLKNPAGASPASWHLWLPPHFNAALDLRFLHKQKTRNKEVVQSWKEWVQGGRFQFNEGSILYDRDVSALPTWGEKMAAIDFYILIHAARPVSVKAVQEEETGRREMRRHPGLVSFEIISVKPEAGAASATSLTLSQDAFVRFAITGQR